MLFLTLACVTLLATPTAGAGTPPPTSPVEPASSIEGTVIESMPAGNYTYTRVRAADGTETWAAAPGAPVAPGSTVVFATSLPMAGFHSDILKRDFDMVYFVGSLEATGQPPPPVQGQVQVPSWHPKVEEGQECPPISAEALEAASAAGLASGVATPHTVADVWAGAAALSGSSVVVRGEVVKFTPGVMGKNWIHLRDGTGAGAEADLTVTTSAEAAVGDRVAATGLLLVDQDFGHGYAYPVILTDARVAPL